MSNPNNFKSSGGFDANNQIISNIADAVSLQDALNLRGFNDKNTVQSYSQTRTYPVGFIVESSGQLWKCISAVTVAGVFDKTKWKAVVGQENWLRITAPYTVNSMDSLLVDTTTNAITITLPGVVASGDYVVIRDAGSAAINNITIDRNGQTINGAAANVVINESDTTATLLYLNGTWVLNTIRVPRIKIASGALTVASNQSYAFDSASSYTVTLPASPKTGDWVEIFDRSGTLGTYTITVSGNSKQIDGLASVALNQKKGGWIFTYNGTSWASTAYFGNGLQANNNLSELTDKAAARTALLLGSLATMNTGTAGGEVRTNTQNDAVYQAKDATLTAMAALVTAADKLIYSTGPDAFAQTDFPAQARTFMAATTQTEQQTAMGLGNAATKTVGLVSGNLMEVGAFGLGGQSTNTTDPNTITQTGFYTVAAGLTNSPSATYKATILHNENPVALGAGATQVATDTTGTLYVRTRDSGGIWSAWGSFATTGSLGTAAFADIGAAAGDVMAVGAFGIGTADIGVPVNIDLDTLVTTGNFYIDGISPNAPLVESSFLTVTGADAGMGRVTQTIRTVSSLRIFERRMFGSVWGGWQELWHTGNLTKASDADVAAKTSDTKFVTPLAMADYTPGLTIGRNKIINGKMEIAQRGTGDVSNTTVTKFPLDRWWIFGTQAAKFTGRVSTVTPPLGFTSYLEIESNSNYSVLATDQFRLAQSIEGVNCSDLAWGTAAAKSVSISFLVRSSLTGVYSGSLRNGGVDMSYPFTFTVTTANVWENVQITIPGPTTGTWLTDTSVGIIVSFELGTGSDYSGSAGSWVADNRPGVTGSNSIVAVSGELFAITGVQLEVGDITTPFEHRHYGLELMLCHRYYYKMLNSIWGAMYATSGYATMSIALPCVMRTTPTYVFGSTSLPITSTSYNGAAVSLIFTGTTGTGLSLSLFTADAEL